MTYKIVATLTHKSFDAPLIKEITLKGDTLGDALDLLERDGTPKNHVYNLRHHRRTAFKDGRGVRHQWRLIGG